MRLENLLINFFRNYENIDINFNSDLIVLVGDNAQGKTNLLEAIYYLATGTTVRTNKDRELINWSNQFFRLKALIKTKKDRKINLDIEYTNQRKIIKINNIRKYKVQDLLGNLNVVLFVPEDLKLIKGSPSDRRGFVNREISQINSQYFYFLAQYNKILNQRNAVLKKYSFDKNKETLALLPIWDNQLTYYGSRIVKQRIEFIDKLNLLANRRHQAISGNTEELNIQYLTNTLEQNKIRSIETVENIKLNYEKNLTNSKNEELKKYNTIIGPHRDDIIFFINGKEIKNFGSQGQQRSAVLSVKLAQISLFKEITGTYPLLLLDDVMSELDENRKNYLLEETQNGIQTLITATDLNFLTNNLKSKAQILKVVKGNVNSF